MDYQVFIEKIVNLLQERMGADYKVRVTNVTKNNDIRLVGVIMMKESDRILPTIYLEEPYRQYLAGDDMQEIVDKIVTLYQEQLRDINFDIDFFKDFEHVRERIFHKVINYEKNRQLLEDVPYFRWHDLAIVFYYAVEEEPMGRASILIHRNHLAIWGRTADELYQTAQRNMRLYMPELILPMYELIEKLTGIKLKQTDGVRMYVLTNQAKLHGASVMLYSDKIRELADILHSDLVILPSSVHEVLILPDNHEHNYDFYRQMVEDVNTTQVEPEEILSYNLYRYSRIKEEIEEISG